MRPRSVTQILGTPPTEPETSIEPVVGRLEGVNAALLAVWEELPGKEPGILTGDLCRLLERRGVKLEGLRLMAVLRFLKVYGHADSNGLGFRWWRT